MSLRERIGWKLLTWRTHANEDGQVELPGLVRKTQRACILLPANFDDFDLVRTFLPELLDRLDGRLITIWVRDNFRSWLVINEYCTVMSYDPAAATRFGLPNTQTLRALKSVEHDLLIDLSLNPELYVTALACELRARTKIALAHPCRQTLYHLLVDSRSGDHARRINALLQYL
ncbi:hypothetical protein KJZ99_02940 [bacterium]|nr:hypothetical protein [bacterium]